MGVISELLVIFVFDYFIIGDFVCYFFEVIDFLLGVLVELIDVFREVVDFSGIVMNLLREGEIGEG